MRVDGQRESDNVEDRRGQGGGASPMALGGGGLGILVLALIVYLLGGDPRGLLKQAAQQQQAQPQQPAGPQAPRSPEEEALATFVKVVLADTEDVWTEQFAKMNLQYKKPKMVLFTGQVRSACGQATSAAGPFYCPGDEMVYLDLTFYEEMKKRFKAPGDFTEQIGTTIIVTEGFGEIAMADRTLAILQSHQGSPAAVNGATQIRAGVIRPEIVIPLPDLSQTDKRAAAVGGGELDIGSPVRIIRDPWFGVLGKVCDLPHEPQLLATGSKARVLEVECSDGRRLTLPRANVEIVST